MRSMCDVGETNDDSFIFDLKQVSLIRFYLFFSFFIRRNWNFLQAPFIRKQISTFRMFSVWICEIIRNANVELFIKVW